MQWALLDDAASAARFYLTELPANGFEIVSGFNNAITTVADSIGQTSVFGNARPPSS